MESVQKHIKNQKNHIKNHQKHTKIRKITSKSTQTHIKSIHSHTKNHTFPYYHTSYPLLHILFTYVIGVDACCVRRLFFGHYRERSPSKRDSRRTFLLSFCLYLLTSLLTSSSSSGSSSLEPRLLGGLVRLERLALLARLPRKHVRRDKVLVNARVAEALCVERADDVMRAKDADVGGQHGVDQRDVVLVGVDLERADLAGGVHAFVGARGAHEVEFFGFAGVLGRDGAGFGKGAEKFAFNRLGSLLADGAIKHKGK